METKNCRGKLRLKEQFELIKAILPEADPDFLYKQCKELMLDDKKFQAFTNLLIENPDFPIKTNDTINQEDILEVRLYTNKFNVKKFLKHYPDPIKYFENPENLQKTPPTNSRRSRYKLGEIDNYKLCLLRNVFRDISKSVITQKLIKHRSLIRTFKELQSPDIKRMQAPRKLITMPSPVQDKELLKEAAYVKHYDEIIGYLNKKEQESEKNKLHAKLKGLMQTCECCYDDEIVPSDIVECESKCKFCKNCLVQYVGITFAAGSIEFLCLKGCASKFNLLVLQKVLSPKLFSSIALQIRICKIKAAKTKNVEFCPICQFPAIPKSKDKEFRCLNSDCKKKTCRLCKELSHIPLRCEEVVRDENVKLRTYIEKKMTDALIRTCWNCNMKFIKSEGCNEMTCTCGARMCYLCQKPVHGFFLKHFDNTIFGHTLTPLGKCPLFSDADEVHKLNVIEGAKAAKEDVPDNFSAGKLISDHTLDIENHYNTKVKPTEPKLEILESMQAEVQAKGLTEEVKVEAKQQEGVKARVIAGVLAAVLVKCLTRWLFSI